MAVPLIAYGLYAGATALAAWLLGTQEGCGGERIKYKAYFNCQSPDPKEFYSDAKVEAWDPEHPEKSSIFVCQGDDKLEHITCDSNGYNIVSDITPCPDDYVCDVGECVKAEENEENNTDSYTDEYACVDSDPSNDPYIAGATTLPWFKSDTCTSSTSVKQIDCIFPGNFFSHDTPKDKVIKWVEEVECKEEEACCFGACTEPASYKCTDSDLSNEPSIKGVLRLINMDTGKVIEEEKDMCGNPYEASKVIVQFSCWEIDENDPCPPMIPFESIFSSCPDGTVCFDGVCVEGDEIFCVDSDADYGENQLYVKGNVSGYNYNDGAYKEVDQCKNDYLLEWACSKYGNPYPDGITCLLGCEDGACIRCIDDDEENEKTLLGTVFLEDGTSKTDYCSNDYPPKVMQIDCDAESEKGYIGNETECGTGQYCDEGVCHDPEN